jgi:hypothetical protein
LAVCGAARYVAQIRFEHVGGATDVILRHIFARLQ